MELSHRYQDSVGIGYVATCSSCSFAWTVFRDNIVIQPDPLPPSRLELLPEGEMPTKANPSDVGYDCFSRVTWSIKGEARIPLGFKLQIPPGWEAQLRGKSGLASRGVHCHLGTIDHLYRKEVCAILISKGMTVIGKGDKVCQMVFSPVYDNPLLQVEKIEDTDRGGFGSTGR